MSLRLPPKKRKQHILKNIGHKTILEIASDCGVDEKTIDRDIKKLKDTGEWQSWVEQVFLKLTRSKQVSDTEKFKQFRHLYAKSIVSKHQVEAKGDLVFKLEAWRPDNADSEDTLPPP